MNGECRAVFGYRKVEEQLSRLGLACDCFLADIPLIGISRVISEKGNPPT